MPIDPSVSVDFLDEGPLAASDPVDALKGFTGSLRFKQCFVRQMFRFYTGRDETAADDPLLRQMFFGFANNDEQDIVATAARAGDLDQLLAAHGGAMMRGTARAASPAAI